MGEEQSTLVGCAVAILLLALACSTPSGGDATRSDASSSTFLTPAEICNSLIRQQVAHDCHGSSGLFEWEEFGVVGEEMGPYKARIHKYKSDDEYASWLTFEKDNNIAPDDYPHRIVLHRPSRTVIFWGHQEDDYGVTQKWEACIKAKRPVAACAKAQPVFYKGFKRLHEAASVFEL